MKQIDPLKATAPDGMQLSFIRSVEIITDKLIFHMIKIFLHHGYMPNELNYTHIVYYLCEVFSKIYKFYDKSTEVKYWHKIK